jgi:hypothetical protein
MLKVEDLDGKCIKREDLDMYPDKILIVSQDIRQKLLSHCNFCLLLVKREDTIKRLGSDFIHHISRYELICAEMGAYTRMTCFWETTMYKNQKNENPGMVTHVSL